MVVHTCNPNIQEAEAGDRINFQANLGYTTRLPQSKLPRWLTPAVLAPQKAKMEEGKSRFEVSLGKGFQSLIINQ
jgi:hypothetical protein